MKISRRETMQLSATALAGLSFGQLGDAAAQGAPQPGGLADSPLRSISTLPLMPDGSAVEFTPQEGAPLPVCCDAPRTRRLPANTIFER